MLSAGAEVAVSKKKANRHQRFRRQNSNTSNNSKLKESSSSKKSKLKSPKEDVKPAKHEEKKVEKITFRRSSGDSWSSSTSASSLSGNASGSKNTALNMLLAEIGDADDDEDDNEVDIFTPFQHSSLQTSVSQKLSGPAVISPSSSSKNKDGCKGKPSNSLPTKKNDTAKNGSKNGLKSPTTKSPPAKESPKIKPKDNKQASNGQHSSTTDLVQLYKRLVALKDSNVLQKVVDIVEASQGRFKITETTLDFDLCLLDKSTIKKIENSVNR
ncbi:protein ENL-like [Montipora capricornis]|uniref:protein ENL-like n=1 Tax=Montipora capricornis TaxID=246305 RepID=UPI0035F16F6F